MNKHLKNSYQKAIYISINKNIFDIPLNAAKYPQKSCCTPPQVRLNTSHTRKTNHKPYHTVIKCPRAIFNTLNPQIRQF